MTICLFALSALVVLINGQCGKPDNERCVQWVKGGFCKNDKYKLERRQSTCGTACKLCPAAPADVCAGKADNDKCVEWKAGGFCTNPAISDAMKKQQCCKACSAPATIPNPVTTCAVIYEGEKTEVVNSGPTKAMEPVVSKQALSKIFVKKGCTLTLNTDPMGKGTPFEGTDAFVTLTGEVTTAMGYTCTCP